MHDPSPQRKQGQSQSPCLRCGLGSDASYTGDPGPMTIAYSRRVALFAGLACALMTGGSAFAQQKAPQPIQEQLREKIEFTVKVESLVDPFHPLNQKDGTATGPLEVRPGQPF